MFEVINSLREEMEKVPVRVSQKCIDNAANSGLETVLSELPEEARTVEIVEHVLHEMLDSFESEENYFIKIQEVKMMVWIHILGIAAIAVSGVTCLNNWLTKYALIVWILQNTNTQPSKEEMIECKKFVIQHVLEDLRKTKM